MSILSRVSALRFPGSRTTQVQRMRFFKSSSDQAYPRLSRICIAVGLVALGVSAVGSWRFGMSLTEDWFDRHWLAVLYVTGDVAAGVLVAVGATMLAIEGWRMKISGFAAMIPALALVSLSILSTFGVMSGRIATLSGHQKAAALDKSRLEWLRGMTVNDEIKKAERTGFLKEERASFEEARKKAEVVTDNQAVATVNLAALFGTKLSVEGAQVALTLASSTIPMAVKFLCLGFGFFLYGLRKPESDRKLAGSSEGSGGKVKSSEESKDKQPETVAPRGETVVDFPARNSAPQQLQAPPQPLPKVSAAAAPPIVPAPAPRPIVPLTLEPKKYVSVEEFLADHPGGSKQKDIAKGLRKSEAKVSRDIKRLAGRGKVKVDHSGRTKFVTLAPRRNGGLYAIGH